MSLILKYFIDKLKEDYWFDGNNWEFDWYLDCFFCEAMSYHNDPVYIGYDQPVFGDRFLAVRPEVDIKLQKRIAMILKNEKEIKDIINRQNKIIKVAKHLIADIKQGKNFDPKLYKEIQIRLSLLMACVSVGFDPVFGKEITKICQENAIVFDDLIQYILHQSSVSALNKSNSKLLEIYKKYKHQIETSKWNYDNLSDNLKTLLIKHSELYGWINTGEREGVVWTPKDFFDQLQKIINTNRKVNRENKPRFPHKYDNLIKQFIEVSKNDNMAADLQVELDYLFQKILKEKLGRFYQEEIIENLTYEEIQDLLINPKQINKYEERKNNYKRLVYVKDKKLYFYYFSSKKEYQSVLSLIKPLPSGNTISGLVACKGKAKGVVKIVRTKNDLDKIQKGDVLVAVKTQPAYVVAMTKAVAIVTDVGGVTSHAAIIAREFGIPCIVGTGNATKMLSDGDLVFVDAEKGIITKLIN